MVAQNRSTQNWQHLAKIDHSKTTANADKSAYKCTHCNKTSHTKSHCFELVGYPDWWDHSHDKKGKNFTIVPTTAAIEINAKDETNMALIAATDVIGKALNISTHISNSTWIIDSGATDHMAFDSRQVLSLKSSSQKLVCTTNGDTTPVIGKGSLTLLDTLYLDSILVVPSLSYKLLSVSQITTALSCVVIFWPEFCVFKDI